MENTTRNEDVLIGNLKHLDLSSIYDLIERLDTELTDARSKASELIDANDRIEELEAELAREKERHSDDGK